MPGLCDELSRYVIRPPYLIRGADQPDEMHCDFLLTAEFSGFHGHFPHNPLLPGIVQIMLARYTAAGGGDARLNGVRRCKFLHPIRPGETVAVIVRPGRAAGEYRATIASNNIPCTVLTFSMECGLLSPLAAGAVLAHDISR